MKTIAAITGASGHLGNVLVPLLVNKGYKVRALVYKQSIAAVPGEVETIRGSLENMESLRELARGCEIVIHCAANISITSRKDPSVYNTNFVGTKNIFDAALGEGVRRFIHLSSIHSFDQRTGDEVMDENTASCLDNAPLYDTSKRDAEKYVLDRAAEGMEVVVLNPTSVVGPFDPKPSYIGKALMDIYNRKVPMLIRGGFDFCDVRDVATGVVEAIDKGRHGEKYLLSGHWHNLEDIQDYVIELKKDKKKLPVVPAWLAMVGLPFINLWAYLIKREPLYTRESILALVEGHKKISSLKAEQELGYSCRPFSDTVHDTINWFKKTGCLE